MIGNDIVDFRKAALESNWYRKGYLDKLFCLEEQNLIFDSANPNQMVWLLWSMKEASYKNHFRQKPIRVYQPNSIVCSNLIIKENDANGEIHYDGQRYFSRSILTTDFIHTSTVIHHTDFHSLRIFIENDNVGHNSLTDHYRKFIIANSLLGYRIIKNGHNIPNLLNERTDERHPLSISHHGRFLSFVFVSNNDLS